MYTDAQLWSTLDPVAVQIEHGKKPYFLPLEIIVSDPFIVEVEVLLKNNLLVLVDDFDY